MNVIKRLFWTTFIVSVLFFPLVHATVCYCSSCSQCAADLSSSSCSKVVLTKDITLTSGYLTECLGVQTHPNKVLDCGHHTVKAIGPGTNTYGYLLDADNQTIENCNFVNFTTGIYIYMIHHHVLRNLTFINVSFTNLSNIHGSVGIEGVADNVLIKNAQFRGKLSSSYSFPGEAIGLFGKNITLTNISFSDLLAGIYLQSCTNVSVSNINGKNAPLSLHGVRLAKLKNISLDVSNPLLFGAVLQIRSGRDVDLQNASIAISCVGPTGIALATLTNSKFKHIAIYGGSLSLFRVFNSSFDHLTISSDGEVKPASVGIYHSGNNTFTNIILSDFYYQQPFFLGYKSSLVNVTFNLTSVFTSKLIDLYPYPKNMPLIEFAPECMRPLDHAVIKNVVVYNNDPGVQTYEDKGYVFGIIYGTIPLSSPSVLEKVRLTNSSDVFSYGINLSLGTTGRYVVISHNHLCFAKVGYYFGAGTTGITGTDNRGIVVDRGSNPGFKTDSGVCAHLLLLPVFQDPINGQVFTTSATTTSVLLNVTSISPTLKNITIRLYNATDHKLITHITCIEFNGALPSPCQQLLPLPPGAYYANATACDSSGACVGSASDVHFSVVVGSSATSSSAAALSGSAKQPCYIVLLVHNRLSQMITITNVEVESKRYAPKSPVNIMPGERSKVVLNSTDFCRYYGRVAFVQVVIWYKTSDGLLHEVSGELPLNG